MIEYGANPNSQDRFGGTPLTDAQRQKSRVGQDLILELLLLTIDQKGASGDFDKRHIKQGYTFSIDLFTAIMSPLQIIILVLYGIYADYEPDTLLDVARYPYYQVMLF